MPTTEPVVTPEAKRRVPRTRGATSGLLLLLLGAWGALIPFIGPYFNFSYTPDDAWKWTAARGWLEVLPGAVTALGGLLLMGAASRTTTKVGAWLGILGGAWFVIGPVLASPLHLGSPGRPAGSGSGLRALETLAMFDLLGVVIVLIAAVAYGRLSVVSVRDVRRVSGDYADGRDVADRGESAERRNVADGEYGDRRNVTDRGEYADRRDVADRGEYGPVDSNLPPGERGAHARGQTAPPQETNAPPRSQSDWTS